MEPDFWFCCVFFSGKRFIIAYNNSKQRKEDNEMFEFISITDALKRCYEKKAILIDVRSGGAFREGHLPMAENVPLEDIIDEKFLPETDLPLIFYCDTGSSSMIAAKKMNEKGKKTYTVSGGISFYKGYLEKEEKELWTMVYVE